MNPQGTTNEQIMKTMNRRSFLKSTALTAAAVSLPASSWARVPGANDEIRIAVVGFGGRGKDHISELRGLAKKNVRIVALCDVDKQILDAEIEQDRKSTRLNSSHSQISYAVFCLKKKRHTRSTTHSPSSS